MSFWYHAQCTVVACSCFVVNDICQWKTLSLTLSEKFHKKYIKYQTEARTCEAEPVKKNCLEAPFLTLTSNGHARTRTRTSLKLLQVAAKSTIAIKQQQWTQSESSQHDCSVPSPSWIWSPYLLPQELRDIASEVAPWLLPGLARPPNRFPITGCAVAQHCYNGDVRFLWGKLEFWPPVKFKPLNRLSKKLSQLITSTRVTFVPSLVKIRLRETSGQISEMSLCCDYFFLRHAQRSNP